MMKHCIRENVFYFSGSVINLHLNSPDIGLECCPLMSFPPMVLNYDFFHKLNIITYTTNL